jgi:hypothetical protein
MFPPPTRTITVPADTLTMNPSPRSSTRPRAIALVLAMAALSVIMWVAIPAAWILLAAHFSHTGRPTLAPLLMVFFGTPLTMLPAAKVLGRLDRRHQELVGAVDERRRPAPWQKSLRDADDTGPRSVLAVVMVGSVAIAFAALAVWFFFFAGSSLPS